MAYTCMLQVFSRFSRPIFKSQNGYRYHVDWIRLYGMTPDKFIAMMDHGADLNGHLDFSIADTAAAGLIQQAVKNGDSWDNVIIDAFRADEDDGKWFARLSIRHPVPTSITQSSDQKSPDGPIWDVTFDF